ncbi:unnamed protein product [Heterobilharzia americana]|nr:unnamed protein product [Heterobilharzia americana]
MYQLKIPLWGDNSYDQRFDQNSTASNKTGFHHLSTNLNENTSFQRNSQSEMWNKNQPSSSELLYSRNTGRLLPPSNNNRSTRARNQTSSCDRSQYLKNTSTTDELFREYEIQIFTLICSILQTNDVNAVQHWLENATDREKSLLISLISTALSHQKVYFDLKQPTEISQKSYWDTHRSRREKCSNNDVNLNTMTEENNTQNCCTTTDRLLIDDAHNLNETHSRGVQANLLQSASDITSNIDHSQFNEANGINETSSLCQTPLKPSWRQHESI